MKVSTNTIIRTIVLVIALVNQILTAAGKNPLPFAEEEIYEIVSTVATLLASVWTWWKNNSFTPEAIKADEVMKEFKANGDFYENEPDFESEVK